MAPPALLFGLVSPEPFQAEWNLRLLRDFFSLLPHNGTRDAVAQFFVLNALASTWLCSGVFYAYWRMEDELTVWRRSHLLAVSVALCLVTTITLFVRPWFGWPAPSLVARFRPLYPPYLWNDGNANCFPSHSTLIYLSIALGFWPFKRWLSALLVLYVLVLISLPRIYVGGHYPIDVLAGILLAAGVAWMARLALAQARIHARFESIVSRGLALEVFLFLWLFELAEGFRSSYWILSSVARAARSIGR